MIVKRTKILVFLVFIMKSVARKTHVLTNGAFTTLPKELESNILKILMVQFMKQQILVTGP